MSTHALNGTALYNALYNALCTVPAEDWARVWCPETTVAVRMTSTAMREQADKMRLPTAVHSNWHGLFERRNSLALRDHRNHVFSQLRLLSSVCMLTTIALVDCGLQGLSLQPLADVLSRCPALEDLDISWNGFRSAGFERIAGPLAECTRLTKLSLHASAIGDLGAAQLASVLTHLPALTYLDIGRNNMTNSGVAEIAEALPNCPAIAVLRLDHNKTGDDLRELTVAMQLCTALAHIDISHTDLGIDGLILMCSAVPFSRHTKIVKLGNPDIEHLENFVFDNSNPLCWFSPDPSNPGGWIPAVIR